MKFPSILRRSQKGIKYIMENHKKELVIGILVLILFVAVVAATVYNSMNMLSTVGVEPTPPP